MDFAFNGVDITWVVGGDVNKTKIGGGDRIAENVSDGSNSGEVGAITKCSHIIIAGGVGITSE